MGKLAVAALGIGALLIAGCRPSEPKSAIVDQVKGAGAGDVSTASIDSLRIWLANHRDLARSLAPQCNAARKTADAKWGDTSEGHVCAADAQVEFFDAAPVKAGGASFGEVPSGKHPVGPR
jgi:hypothetical protein